MNATTVTMKMLIRNHRYFILVTPLTISNLSHISAKHPAHCTKLLDKILWHNPNLPQINQPADPHFALFPFSRPLEHAR
jgi:hypothetical protein